MMSTDLYWLASVIRFGLWLSVAAITSRYCLKRWISRHHENSEPQELHALFPGVGHLFGLVRHGLKYYVTLNSRQRLPAYTIQMLGQKMYIINSPDLVVAVQRNTKDFSFAPFVAAMAPRLFQIDEAAIRILNRNLNGGDGPPGLIDDTHHDTWPFLALGEDLDLMVSTLMSSVIPFLDEIAGYPMGDGFDLYTSVRRALTIASTDVLYGPQNPFRHHESLIDAFWTFEKDATFLLLGIAPSLIARKAEKARSDIFNAMRDYTINGHEVLASPLTRKRYEVYRRHGLSTDAIAKFELSSIFGILINAIPSMFWLLFYVYSDAPLLTEIREELSPCFEVKRTSRDNVNHIMNMAHIRENTPLLTSCYRETLRLKTNSAYTRHVCRNTTIRGNDVQYLLKEGSILQIPGASMHADPALWGQDVGKFNPRRFLKSERVHRPGSFRSFGGGSSICPGRHFAAMEIIGTAAIWLMRFDMKPIKRLEGLSTTGTRWEMPKTDGNDVICTISPPTSPCYVKAEVRETSNGSWSFEMGQSNKGFEVS